jgi:hypothetical protein
MRSSAKHMVLVSMLFPALLLLACNTPTGLRDAVPPAEEPEVAAPREAPGPSVDADRCFQFNGEQYCLSTERSDEFRQAL